MMRGNGASPESDLILIARDVTGQIITSITCTRSHEVMSAMKSAYSVLRLKEGAVRVEVHRKEAPTSSYPGKPLAAITRDDLSLELLR